MLKRCLALTLMVLLPATAGGGLIFARAQSLKGAQPAEQIKAGVLKRGTGEKARVTVRRRDGTKLKGYISQSGEDSFVVTEPKGGQSTTVAYGDVAEVKGAGMSRAAKIGIGAAIGVGAAAAVLAVAFRDFEPFGTARF